MLSSPAAAAAAAPSETMKHRRPAAPRPTGNSKPANIDAACADLAHTFPDVRANAARAPDGTWQVHVTHANDEDYDVGAIDGILGGYGYVLHNSRIAPADPNTATRQYAKRRPEARVSASARHACADAVLAILLFALALILIGAIVKMM